MIKAILFDLDNTLIDFWTMKKVSCEAAVAAMIDAGLKLPREKAMKGIYKLYDKHGFEDQKVFQRFMKNAIGKTDYKILANAIVAYRKVKSSFLEPYPHVTATLLSFKKRGIRLGIVTDAPRIQAWVRLASMRLMDFFDVVVAHEDTKEFKPSKMPFKAALKKLELKPYECLMVGDWPERDIKGAKLTGMLTCFARYGNPKAKNVKADYEINDIKELLEIVE